MGCTPLYLIPISGFEYKITVAADSYPSIVSKPVKIPSEPQVISSNTAMINNGKQVTFSIVIQDDVNELNYYTYKRDLYNQGVFIKVSDRSREDKIPVFMNTESDQLFNGNDFTFSMTFNKEMLLFENFIPVDTIVVDSVKATVYSVSTEYDDYFKSLPDGVEFGGFLPLETSIFTNIENGYGVIGAYAIKEISDGL